MGVLVFHCADIHLDSPFSVFSPEEAVSRRTGLMSAFTSALLFADNKNADVFLISGDLFDVENVQNGTYEFLFNEFSRYHKLKFFISPGNHDPINEASIYKRFKFPPNVHIFDENKSFVDLPELNARIYGFGFPNNTYISSPIIGYPPLDADKINILVCHGEFGVPLSEKGRITKKEIAASDFDYIALGHIHKGSGLQKEGDTYYAYPGCLEGRSYDETGIKGALFGIVDKNKVDLSMYKFSNKRYEIIKVDITDCHEKSAAVEKIKKAMREFSDDTALRVILTGEVSDSYLISKNDFGKGREFPYHMEFIDKTVMKPNYFAIESDVTLKGVFYRKMMEKIDRANAESEEHAQLLSALKIGLNALDDRSFIDWN